MDFLIFPNASRPVSEDLEVSGIVVSAEKGTGLDKLKDCIQESLLEATNILPCQLEIPMSDPQLR